MEYDEKMADILMRIRANIHVGWIEVHQGAAFTTFELLEKIEEVLLDAGLLP